jgi:integrase
MRGHVRRRGKESWSIVVDVGGDPNGRRRQKWHTVQGTKKDAERELARLLYEMNTGAYVQPARLTVAEYLSRWLTDYAEPNVPGKTFERYSEIANLHLVPALGHHLLTKVRPLHIQSYYSEALKDGRKGRRKGGLSAQTVLHHHRVLRQAFQQAVRWQLLARNPADAVEPPRPKRQQMAVLDEGETRRLFDEVKGTRLFIPVVLAVTTGLRRGEILGLHWSDVDLEKRNLAVRQSLEQTKAGLKLKEPKSQKGRRTVTLPRLAVDALRRHKAEQAKERLLMGPAYDDGGFVCARPDGRPWDPRSMSHAFVDLIKESGFRRIRFHDLRHGHATHLLRQGIHPKVVSERLGHSTVGITLDVYSHVVPGMQEEAAERIDEVLGPRKRGRRR